MLADLSFAPPFVAHPFVAYAEPTLKAPRLLVLVGEAPGAEEAKHGTPFIGRSGQLLNSWLSAANINRAACLVANVFRYQPPSNKIGAFFCSKQAAAQKGQKLAEQYGPLGGQFCLASMAGEIDALANMLQQTQPALVLSFGRTALWALTGHELMSKNRGQIWPCRLAQNIKVLPTWHPSYVLRGNKKAGTEAQQDIIAAAAIVTSA